MIEAAVNIMYRLDEYQAIQFFYLAKDFFFILFKKSSHRSNSEKVNLVEIYKT